MPEAFIDPLKLLHSKILAQDDIETTEIDHWSHPGHSLILNVEDPQGNDMMPNINSGDLIKVCCACVQPLSLPYYSCKDDGCSVFTDLHKYCAHLPQTLQHQLHPHHTLDLVDTSYDQKYYLCNGCFIYGNAFAYKCETKCEFYLCVNCAFLPKTIKPESHNHPLTPLIDPEVICKACNTRYGGMSYSCKACDFVLGIYRAMGSPLSLAHRYCKGHEIPLTYPRVDDHPEDFYCEEEMNPNLPLYHCQNCKYRNSFHLGCIIRRDYYANVWYSRSRSDLRSRSCKGENNPNVLNVDTKVRTNLLARIDGYSGWITLRFSVAFGAKCGRHLRRDTVQLEAAVSTISHESLVEFISEYDISEDLHSELPGPEERIVDFPKGKQETREKHSSMQYQAFRFPKKLEQPILLGGQEDMDLFNLICAPIPTKVKTGTHPRAAHEVSLLTVTASRVIEMEDPVAATDSSGNVTTTGVTLEADLAEEIAATGSRVIKERRKRGNDGVDTNAPPKVLRRDHVASQPTQSTIGGKSLTAMGLGMGSTCHVPTSRDTPVEGVTNGCRLDTPEAYQDLVDHIAPPRYFSELRHLYNDDFLKQYNINLARQVAMGSQLRLRFKQGVKLLKKSAAQVARRDQRIQAKKNEIKNLEALLEAETDMKKTAEAKNTELGEEKLKAAFEEFKQYENDRVEKRCVEMDTHLDALSMHFDEELYPHMLSVIAEELKFRVGHGKANLDLEAIEAYDLEADAKYVAALHALRDLKSDGDLVSLPTVAPQGLANMLADAATQTEASEDGASHYQA
nr:C1-like protein [Tanacetum cinerariifolium]